MQIINGDGLGATLIQGMFGVEVDIPAGHMKLENGQSAQVVHTGAAAGFVLGTNAPAMLPVTNDQLADKGFSSRLRVAYEFFLNPFMGVGAQADFGYHYLLGGEAVNMTQDHSSGYHVIGLATFTFHLGFYVRRAQRRRPACRGSGRRGAARRRRSWRGSFLRARRRGRRAASRRRSVD